MRDEKFNWTRYVTGDEENIVKGSSTSVYMKNRLILNGGANMTVNPLTMATNINAGTTMNLNLAPSVTYQIADTLTTGPGRVYSANQSYTTVGLDSIKLVAGLEGAERTKCLRGWKGLTFAAATLLGMAVSIVPVVYNHFSPQNRLEPLHQAIGTYAASSLSFLFYWVQSRAFDGFDMAVPKDRLGRPTDYNDNISDRYGGAIITLNNVGVIVLGSRKVHDDWNLHGTDDEGGRPAIMVGDGDVGINAEQGGPNGLLSNILMRPGSLYIEGGHSSAKAIVSLNRDKIEISRHERTIIMDNNSLRLGTNADTPINQADPDQCMVMITDNTIEATGEDIRLQASGTKAIFGESGAIIRSNENYIYLSNDCGILINGKRLNLDTDNYVYLG